jgi:calcineurin-like phosphoesterase family protein
MDETMINNWNSVVTAQDTVYFLGDFSLGSPRRTQDILYSLNGNIILIKGNHEKSALKRKYCRDRFESIYHYNEIEENGRLVCLFHYPIQNWNGKSRGSIHLHGHVHRKDGDPVNEMKNRFNVNVEYINYTPRTLQQIITNDF